MSDSKSITSGDGEIVVATRGARVLSCRVSGFDENLFYDDGKGLGGDRLWIAPEVAYYWPSLEDARRDPKGTAATPADIDPGGYEVVGDYEEGEGIVLKNDCSLIDSRDEKAIGIETTRSIGAAPAPGGLPAELKCVSFGITNTVSVVGGDAGAVASAWDILQVPPTGTLICPTKRKVAPRSYYDPFGDKHVVCDDEAVRFLIDAQRRVKMGIRPEDTPGTMGYYRTHGGGTSSLIFRAFDVEPGQRYVDIPRDHPIDQRDGGDAIQAYNDDQTYGNFGEMEFVAPAVVVGEIETRASSCVTHVLVGPDEAVRAFGETLLGVSVSMTG